MGHAVADGDKVVEERIVQEVLDMRTVEISVTTDLHREEGLLQTCLEEWSKVRVERLVQQVELLLDLGSQDAQVLFVVFSIRIKGKKKRKKEKQTGGWELSELRPRKDSPKR